MEITMQVALHRLGRHAHLWADGRTDLPWSDGEIAALSWLERRYTLADLRVILERAESCIRDRQEATHGPTPIELADVTFLQLTMRDLAASALGRERCRHKWTAGEDAALCWLAERCSIADLQVILRRPIPSVEKRLLRLDIDHPGVEQHRRERQAAPTMRQRALRVVLYLAAFFFLLALSLWLR